MRYLAIAYPEISDTDLEWIQRIRREHDKIYYDVVRPHVTLVFGTSKLDDEQLAEHVHSRTAGMKTFPLDFSSARLVEDDSKKFFHAFLIPSLGYEEIDNLHTLMYQGVLESELRHDILFIPHLGIGTGTEEEMTKLVDELNSKKMSIKGQVGKIAIVQYDGNMVTNLNEVPLE